MPQNLPLKNLFLVLAVIAVVFGVLGLMDLANVPYAGYFTNVNSEVTDVFSDGPAAAGGLEVGDVVKTSGGISTDDTKELARRSRADIGSTRILVVDRGGETVEVDITFTEQPGRNRVTTYLAFVVALCFLVCCLWAYGKVPGPATLRLALFGLCFGIAFVPAPYSESYFLRNLGGNLATTFVVLGFAFLIHFLLLFPKRRAFLDKPAATKIIYGPAVFIALYFLYLGFVQPDFTGGLRTITGVLVGAFIVGYFGWSLVTVIQSYQRATPEERSSGGVSLMLYGTLIGLLPVTISNLVSALAPSVTLPGFQYYGLLLGLIPITFALAAVKKESG
jgi:hypothetical protein